MAKAVNMWLTSAFSVVSCRRPIARVMVSGGAEGLADWRAVWNRSCDDTEFQSRYGHDRLSRLLRVHALVVDQKQSEHFIIASADRLLTHLVAIGTTEVEPCVGANLAG
jgi:hypothetical protein